MKSKELLVRIKNQWTFLWRTKWSTTSSTKPTILNQLAKESLLWIQSTLFSSWSKWYKWPKVVTKTSQTKLPREWRKLNLKKKKRFEAVGLCWELLHVIWEVNIWRTKMETGSHLKIGNITINSSTINNSFGLKPIVSRLKMMLLFRHIDILLRDMLRRKEWCTTSTDMENASIITLSWDRCLHPMVMNSLEWINVVLDIVKESKEELKAFRKFNLTFLISRNTIFNNTIHILKYQNSYSETPLAVQSHLSFQASTKLTREHATQFLSSTTMTTNGWNK